MLTVKDLEKSFQQVRALQRVTLTVPRGELCGLLGRNGAGKSTLFKIVMGLLAADAGEIAIAGETIHFGEVEYKRRLGYAPETPVFYEYLTGHEFLHFIAAAKAVAPAQRPAEIAKWLAFFELEGKAGELLVHYSHGMRRKISLCAALLGAPTILLLDEATNGLDPESSFRLKEYLSHIIETIEHLCDRLVILEQGRVLRELQRREWDELRQRGSSLEKEFMAIIAASLTARR
ncbi:ABC transporter ATP-binding protein [candidate division KSB1 bacterium]|nr:ABC transporter ATP-binding protein [candidate division KSB1 bacterium]